jgi:hypothetical protein
MKKIFLIVILLVCGLAVLSQTGILPKLSGQKVDAWRPYYHEVSKVRSSNPILELMPADAASAIRSVSYKAVPRAGVREAYWESDPYTRITVCPRKGGTCSVITVMGASDEVPRKLELIKAHWNWVELMNRCSRPDTVESNIGCPKQGWISIGKQFDIDLVSRARDVLANANDGRGSTCDEHLFCPAWESHLGPLPL